MVEAQLKHKVLGELWEKWKTGGTEERDRKAMTNVLEQIRWNQWAWFFPAGTTSSLEVSRG